MDGTLPTIPDRHVRCGGRALQTDREQTPAPRPGSTTKLNDRDRPGRNRHARRAQQPIHDPRAPASAGELGPVKNGPPLCGYGAAAMNTSLTTSMTTLREQLRKSLTWDRAGRNTPVTPSSPSIPARECSSPTRTRPGNDRQARTRTDRCASTSRSTDLSRWSAEDLEAVALAINNRPRKLRNWRTPAEIFAEQLRSLQQPAVASDRLKPPNTRHSGSPSGSWTLASPRPPAESGTASTTRSPRICGRPGRSS